MLTFCGIRASQLIATQIVAVVFFGFAQGHVNGYDLFEGNPCKLKDGTPGVCTIVDQCASVYAGLLTNTLPYTQVAENRCGFMKQKEVVCCTDSQPDPSNSRITPKVPTSTRSENTQNTFPGRGSSAGSAEWSLVSRPLVKNNKLINQNVESVREQYSATGQNENEDKLSSRFFLGNLLSPQNSRNDFQNPHGQNQQGNVRCTNYYIPTTTTPPPVQRRSGILGFLNFNKPAQTTPRTSVLAPVLDALRPIKEIPLNFISSIGNRNGINLQGQFNMNQRQPVTFDNNNNELCVDTNFEQMQGGQNPNTLVPQNSMNANQPLQPFQSIPMQIPSIDQNQNAWNIPSQPMSGPFVPLNFMNGNQPMLPFQSMTPVQNQNQNQNQHTWYIPASPTSVPFGLPNTINGNQPFQPVQPMAPFQPVPTMQNPNTNQNNGWNNFNSGISSPFVDNTFGTTSTHPVIETNNNWDKKEFPDKVQTTKPTIEVNQAWNVKDSDNFNLPLEVPEQPISNFRTTTADPLNNGHPSFEPWMVESLRATTIATTTSTTRTPKTDPSKLDPWMEDALKESSSKRLIVQENRNPKPLITQPNISGIVKPDSNKNEPLRLPPSSVLDPWMAEALGEAFTSTQLPTNPDRPKKDTPNIPSSQSFQNTTTSFGDSVLDPWMKEALQEDLRYTTSTPRTTEVSVSNEDIPPSIREFPGENNNEKTVLDSWMTDALGAVSSAKPSIDTNPTTKPTSLRPPVTQDTHAEETVGVNLSSFDNEFEMVATQSSKRAVDSSQNTDERSRRLDSSKFTSSSNASSNLPHDAWVWDHKVVAGQKESQPESTNVNDEDLNYWINEALKSKTKPLEDKPWSSELHSASIPSNPNSREKHFGRENLGVGMPLPRPRNGTNRVNNGLFNDIFDIPDNRGGDKKDGEIIDSRSSDGAAAACVKYKREFGVAVTYHILGGIAAQLGEFAHMAALGYPSTAANREYDWNCGASLISDQYLITSAHCITRSGPTKARLGKISIDTDEDGAIALDVDIEESILYPNYTNAKQYDDIALIRLNRKVTYTENIRPACLNTNKNPMPPSTSVTVTGWGTISLRTRRRSSVLLKANLTTVELNSCNQAHTDYGHNRKLPLGLTETQICAYDPELVKDACEGDSGGPLQIVDDSGISTIYGITSFGVSCASKIPGVYARVSHYLEWIESIVWP